jgi:ABC-type sulfate transport system substrate-binding protein
MVGRRTGFPTGPMGERVRKGETTMIKKLVHTLRGTDWRTRAGYLFGIGILVAVGFYSHAILVKGREPIHLIVYAFSTQEEPLTQGIFPAFERMWKLQTGQQLTIEGVFGPSTTMAGQINLGAPADVALFSNAQDVIHLVVGRRVGEDVQPAVIGLSPIVIVTRPGNPAGIESYADLAQPGLNLLHADPRSSGAGQWAVLAEYGSAFVVSGSSAEAGSQLEAIWRNVRLLAPSARAAMTLFELGAGDAFLTYEQDARLALDRGVPIEIVVPPHTIVAQPVAVVVDDNVTAAERPAAKALIQYLQSTSGQETLRRYHLRSTVSGSGPRPTLVDPFTVEELGGWSRAYLELIETVWQIKIAPNLDAEPTPDIIEPGGD